MHRCITIELAWRLPEGYSAPRRARLDPAYPGPLLPWMLTTACVKTIEPVCSTRPARTESLPALVHERSPVNAFDRCCMSRNSAVGTSDTLGQARMPRVTPRGAGGRRYESAVRPVPAA